MADSKREMFKFMKQAEESHQAQVMQKYLAGDEQRSEQKLTKSNLETVIAEIAAFCRKWVE